MRKCTRAAGRNTIGLDLGDKYCHFYALDPKGERVNAGRIRDLPTLSGSTSLLWVLHSWFSRPGLIPRGSAAWWPSVVTRCLWPTPGRSR